MSPSVFSEPETHKEESERLHLTHLQLEHSSLLLHILCDFSSTELCSNHPVLLRVFPLLLLNLYSAENVETEAKEPNRSVNCVFLFMLKYRLKCKKQLHEVEHELFLTVWSRNPSRLCQTASSGPEGGRDVKGLV